MSSHSLGLRALPLQSRASKTVDLILTSAAELLEKSGFEELTTNKICEHAGLTPPALYRYFPGKYAVVAELALRLVQKQNAAVFEAVENTGPSEPGVATIAAMLEGQVRITREFMGGVAILRTLYATPHLAEVRLSSHALVTERLFERLAGMAADLSSDVLRQRLRLMVEVGNSVVEMIVENPDMNEEAILRDTAEMLYFVLHR